VPTPTPTPKPGRRWRLARRAEAENSLVAHGMRQPLKQLNSDLQQEEQSLQQSVQRPQPEAHYGPFRRDEPRESSLTAKYLPLESGYALDQSQAGVSTLVDQGYTLPAILYYLVVTTSCTSTSNLSISFEWNHLRVLHVVCCGLR
jgi:hypothetical protein